MKKFFPKHMSGQLNQSSSTHIFKTQHNITLTILALLIISIQGLMVFNGVYDNDMWFIVATGKEILTNGIPYINPFSMHENMGIIVQQWIPSVIDYLVYSNFGMLGIGFLTLFLFAILVFSLYKLGKISAGNKIGTEIIFGFIALMMPVLMAYISVRPQIYTMIAFCWILYICLAYRKNKNTTLLCLLPIITLLHVNFHASMVLFDLFIIGLFLLPNIKIKPFKITFKNYNRIPILLALIVSAAFTLFNPYGIQGALYLLLSYGAAGYSDYIKEMSPLIVWSSYGIFMMIIMMIAAISIGRRGIKYIDVPLYSLFLVTSILSLQHVRNVWLVALFSLPIICSVLIGKNIKFNSKLLKDSINKRVSSVILLIVVVAVSFNFFVTDLLEDETKDTAAVPSAAMNYLEENNIDKNDTKIFNFFNNGGYIEWRGYNSFMDPRPELWEPAITGQPQEYYKEFVDMAKGNTDISTITDRYNFDYLIVNRDTKLETYLIQNQNYEIILKGNGYDLWKRL